MSALYPQRIVCLTEETVETLYLLGAEDRIVGVSSFCVRPEEAKSKPKVSTFIDAKFDEIEELKPDLVLGFSDLQADLGAELVRRGLEVHLFNHRSVADIFRMIRMLGGMVGLAEKADALAEQLEERVEAVRAQAQTSARRPRVFFEEWDDPIISGIQWVSELIEIAGGEDLAASRVASLAKDRIWTREEIAELNPELILVSWCGKKFRPSLMKEREEWQSVDAIVHDRVYEIPSEIILQPGPAALTDGLDVLVQRIQSVD
ncbi:MAG: cobalamin-binding protein [Planctomycetes bacterium]|nr:cobalamin-binding protein [Planctomycetota bacterium]